MESGEKPKQHHREPKSGLPLSGEDKFLLAAYEAPIPREKGFEDGFDFDKISGFEGSQKSAYLQQFLDDGTCSAVSFSGGHAVLSDKGQERAESIRERDRVGSDPVHDPANDAESPSAAIAPTATAHEDALQGSLIDSEIVPELLDDSTPATYDTPHHAPSEWRAGKPKKKLLIGAGVSLIVAIIAGIVIFEYTEFRGCIVERSPQSPVDRPDQNSAQRAEIRKEAERIAGAIIITGWEDGGDFLGHLVQIAGFYERHKVVFPTESQSYERQLREWQDFFARKRDAGEPINSTDFSDLEGLVSTARDQLRRIAREE